MGESPRNYGIDLLRCISMFMVVILHILSHGGVMNSACVGGLRYNVLSFLEVLVYPAVDIFAIISGYLMVSKEFHGKKIVHLWLEVVFYSIMLMVGICFIHSGVFSIKGGIKTILPTLSGQYWYFTAYFGMYFFIPYMNKLLRDICGAKKLIFTCIIIFSILPTLIMQDPFLSNWGYSTVWLSICYMIGGYIRFYIDDCTRPMKILSGYWGVSLIIWLSKITLQKLTSTIGISGALGYYFLSYTSPLVLLQACLLLIGIRQIKFSNRIRNVLKIFSPCAFAVYLIHENYFVKQEFILNRLVKLNSMNLVAELGAIFFIAVGIFSVSILIDLVRIQVFRVLRFTIFADYIGDSIENVVKKLIGNVEVERNE